MMAPEGLELVIAFGPGTDQTAAAKFIDELRGSQWSSLTFKSAIAPSP